VQKEVVLVVGRIELCHDCKNCIGSSRSSYIRCIVRKASVHYTFAYVCELFERRWSYEESNVLHRRARSR